MQYRIAHRYTSMRDGNRYGPWAAGALVDLDPADAEWVNTDSPGTCVLPEAPLEPKLEASKVTAPTTTTPDPGPNAEPEKAEEGGETEGAAAEASEGEPKPAAEAKKPGRNRAHTPSRTRQ